MKRALVLVVILSLLTPIYAGDTFDVKVIPDNPYYKGGDTARVSVVIANNTQFDLENVRVELFSKGPFSIEDPEYYLGDMGHGWKAIPKRAIFEIEIDENANAGKYTIEGRIESKNFSQEFDCELRIVSEVLISVGNITYPDSPEPGETFDLGFNLNNEGGAKIEWAKLILMSDVFMPAKGSMEQIRKNIDAGETIHTVFSLKTDKKTLQGVYPLTLSITYKDEFGNVVTEKKTIAVEIEEMKDVVIDINEVSTGTLSPGDDFELHMNIQNSGEGKIEWLKIGIDPVVNSIPILTPNNDDLTKVYNDVGGNTSTEVEFDLSINEDLDSGTYPISVNLAYKNERGEIVTETHTLGLEIRGVPRIVIQGADSDPKVPFKGDEVTLSVNLENIGTGDAKVAKVTFSSDLGTFVSYVGGIGKEESSAAVFNTIVPADAGKKINVAITVEYEGETGNKKTLEDVYILTVKERESRAPLILGAAVLFVIGILAWWIKRHREMKKLME